MGLPLDPDWAVREGAVREGAVRTHSLLGARDLGKQGAKGLPGLWNLQPPLLSSLSSCGLASTPPQTPSSHFPRAQEAPLVVQAEFIVFWAVLCVWAGAAPEGSSLWAHLLTAAHTAGMEAQIHTGFIDRSVGAAVPHQDLERLSGCWWGWGPLGLRLGAGCGRDWPLGWF